MEGDLDLTAGKETDEQRLERLGKAAKVKREKDSPPVKSLAARLCAVMGAVKNIPKNGYNSFHKYAFMKEGDVATAMRELLAKEGVFIMPTIEEVTTTEHGTTNSGATKWMTRVRVKYTFINSENPDETYETIHYGDSLDNEDKGIYKALTGCHKYFYLRTFSLGTDDDPESTNEDQSVVNKVSSSPSSRSNEHKPAPNQPHVTQTKGGGFPSGTDWNSYAYCYNVPYKIMIANNGATKDLLKSKQSRWNPDNKYWYSNFYIDQLKAYVVGEAPPSNPALQQVPLEQDNFGWDSPPPSDDAPPIGEPNI